MKQQHEAELFTTLDKLLTAKAEEPRLTLTEFTDA
jgi:hypothetical protein